LLSVGLYTNQVRENAVHLNFEERKKSKQLNLHGMY